jgi:hypothetical protein
MGFRPGGYYYPGWVDAVWVWLIRRRYRREPWYTEESVVNVNAERFAPELQHLRAGDRIQDGPDGYFEVRAVLPERALVLYSARHPLSGRPVDPGDPRTGAFVECSWVFVLEGIAAETTRLRVRLRADYTPGPAAAAAVSLLVEPGDWLLQHLMLAGLKARAERPRPATPAADPAPTG